MYPGPLRPPSNGTRSGAPDRAERAPDLNRLIRERAYLLYQSSGCEHGHALEHWLEAERQVMVSLQSERDQNSQETGGASRSR